MTRMSEKAFSEAAKLPDMEQNALAKWVLSEIESDRNWNALFAESEDILIMSPEFRTSAPDRPGPD